MAGVRREESPGGHGCSPGKERKPVAAGASVGWEKQRVAVSSPALRMVPTAAEHRTRVLPWLSTVGQLCFRQRNGARALPPLGEPTETLFQLPLVLGQGVHYLETKNYCSGITAFPPWLMPSWGTLGAPPGGPEVAIMVRAKQIPSQSSCTV